MLLAVLVHLVLQCCALICCCAQTLDSSSKSMASSEGHATRVISSTSCGLQSCLRLEGTTYGVHYFWPHTTLRAVWGMCRFPQVYIDGEFFGGCDIMIEAYQSGELQETLERVRNE